MPTQAWTLLWATSGQATIDPRGFICVSRRGKADRCRKQYLEGMKAGDFCARSHYTPADGGGTLTVPRIAGSIDVSSFTRPKAAALHSVADSRPQADWLSRNSATVLVAHPMVSHVAPEGRVACSSKGVIPLCRPRRLVTAAPPEVPKLFPKLVADLTTYRTAVVYLEPPADLKAAWEKAPVILDVGGETDGYIIPPTGGAGLKFGSGLHKEATDDPSANRAPRPSEGDKIRNLFGPPIARIEDYAVKETLSCACTFTEDERFFAHEAGRALVVSACFWPTASKVRRRGWAACCGRGSKAATWQQTRRWAAARSRLALALGLRPAQTYLEADTHLGLSTVRSRIAPKHKDMPDEHARSNRTEPRA